MKWKWVWALGSFSIAMVSCTMREAESPAASSDGRIEQQNPNAQLTAVSPGISTLRSDKDRPEFDVHLIDQLATIDARTHQISRLYEAGDPDEKDRMSERWQTVLQKRSQLDENRRALDLAVGRGRALAKADVIANLTILEQALDDVEFVFSE